MSPTAFEGLPASTVIEPRERRAWQAGEVVCAQGQQGVTVFDGLGGDPYIVVSRTGRAARNLEHFCLVDLARRKPDPDATVKEHPHGLSTASPDP